MKTEIEAALLIGIPGAGKSTFYRQQLIGTHVRINLDTLKRRPRELRAVEACIAAGQSFAVDNTNLLAFDRARYIPLAKAAGYRIVGYWLDCPVEDALKRNDRRSGNEFVPSHVIRAFHAKVEEPGWNEGFDALYRVSIEGQRFVVKQM